MQYLLTLSTLIISCGSGILSLEPLELNQELRALACTAIAGSLKERACCTGPCMRYKTLLKNVIAHAVNRKVRISLY